MRLEVTISTCSSALVMETSEMIEKICLNSMQPAALGHS